MPPSPLQTPTFWREGITCGTSPTKSSVLDVTKPLRGQRSRSRRWKMVWHIPRLRIHRELLYWCVRALCYPCDHCREPATSDLSTSDPSSVSIDIDDSDTMETADSQPLVAMERHVPNNQPIVHYPVDTYYSSFPPLPTFAPLPPAPLVPISLEGENELLAPNLTEDVMRAVEPLDSGASEEQSGFGIVAEQALINTPLPGGHAPLFYPQQELVGMMQPVQPHPPIQQGSYLPTQQGIHPPIQQGSHSLVQQGSHPPVQQGSHPLVQQGSHPLVQQGSHPPIQQGSHPLIQQGSHPPIQQGSHPLIQQGSHPPIQQGSHPLVQQGSHPPIQQAPLILNRVVEGPLPNPPSYEQSLTLPSLPPVQPIPPPVSRNPTNQFVQSSPAQLPSSQSTNLNEKDARIRELEERLASTERAAHEAHREEQKRQEAELSSLRDQVSRDRARLEEETRCRNEEVELARAQLSQEQERARAVMEAQRRAMEEERQRMNMERGQLAAMKEQVERERAQMIEAGRQHTGRAQLEQRRREEQQRVFSLQSGLPPTWEKRLDRTTGRFYYVDHETKTTHWNPPTNWINYQRARQEEMERRKHPQTTPTPQSQPTPQPLQPTRPTPTPSAQSQPTPTPPPTQSQPAPTPPTHPPTQSQPTPTLPAQPTPKPVVDRLAKPEATPTQPTIPDRSKKPVAKQPVLMTPAMQKQKQQNLQAVFGTRVCQDTSSVICCIP